MNGKNPDNILQFNKPILTLEADSTGHVKIETQLPPQQIVKLLFNSAVDILFQNFEQRRIKTL